ncbi:MAG: hypothetical protein QNJ47_25340, partial [Nostocaceae cyanobacterium]|nr:hypothetical protein [Nostocaceae cyanobacterium]
VCPIKYDGVSITPTWDYKSQSNSQSHINMTIKLAIKTNGTEHYSLPAIKLPKNCRGLLRDETQHIVGFHDLQPNLRYR